MNAKTHEVGQVKPLEIGQRVRHNYENGHGQGRIVGRLRDGSEPLSYSVQWDTGYEVMSYTHNDDNQEIVAV